MSRQNCWEFMKCGRGKGSVKGICPAALETRADRVNKGLNGGRVCWAVTGTCCDGKVQGTYAQKLLTCLLCEFRSKVREEEKLGFRHIYI